MYEKIQSIFLFDLCSLSRLQNLNVRKNVSKYMYRCDECCPSYIDYLLYKNSTKRYYINLLNFQLNFRNIQLEEIKDVISCCIKIHNY